MKSTGILNAEVGAVPFAVIDFETTGLNPGTDRVVEVSVLRVDPDDQANAVLDTMVNPCRPMAATEIHGIADEDVADAPRFSEIASTFVHALSGCVVAAYNVYFDMRFLEYELSQTGLDATPPHLCLMYMRPMLGLGKRCSLPEACRAHGVDYREAHTAHADATAASQLLSIGLATAREQGIRTFGDLARLKNYKFFQSFANEPLYGARTSPSSPGRLKSRSLGAADTSADGVATHAPVNGGGKQTRSAMHSYWDELKTVIADLEVTDDEVLHLLRTKRALGLADEQTRVLHARAFATVISQFTADQWLDDVECRKLRKLRTCLSRAGWAPGD